MSEPAGETLETLEVQFESSGTTRVWRLELDRGEFTQRIMLDAVAGGAQYEPESAHLLLSTLRQGDVFIDVAAHVGYFSVLAGVTVGPMGTVVSFSSITPISSVYLDIC